MANNINGDRVISGTFGELWLDGDYVAEVLGVQAKVELIKQDVPLAGKKTTDQKVMGYKGNGTVRMHKVNSRMIRKMSADILRGVSPRMQLLSSLNDPGALGAERVLIKDASFNDLTLIDWELQKLGEIEAPFTFTDWELKDTINN
ncbi:phage tail tube protein [Paenibacillus tyrfis]|uniref:phage tail tube protein n=1 Tax=Paenibacillus tyrfis TaxID=1501230 RepID=UPI000B595339|nr:phage tail tube protein [Paenibacillus tyrfis]